MAIYKSEKVTIKVKVTDADKARLGENATLDMIHNKHKIGSSFEHGGTTPMRGLTFEEERKFLPEIIGVSADSDKFTAASLEYWKNISREVPSDIGISLEVGMIYPDEKAEKEAEKEAEIEARNLLEHRLAGRRYDEQFKVRTSVGVPINLTDYILYRYCLKYSRVARNPDDMYKSKKIGFYIHSDKAEKAVQGKLLKQRQKAYATYLELVTDRTKTANVAVLLKKTIQRYNELPTTKEVLSINDEISMDTALEKISTLYPIEFITIANDKALTMKAFVERAIDANELRRLPNTETIVYGDNTVIGTNLDEAVAYLSQSAHKDVLATLEARLKAFVK